MTIKYKIRDQVVLLPDDHLLPAYQKDHPTYDMTFDQIYQAIGAYAPERYFVDLGANVGDTAIVMRHNAKNPILCVEGHPQFLVYLRENIEGLADISIVPAFVGADEVSGPLGFSGRGGTGRLMTTSEPKDESLPVATRSLRSILEEEGALRSGIALFKTDTDGMDAFILQEFLKLEQRDTALFFECDVKQTMLGEHGNAVWNSIFSTLRERGYSLVIFDNFGYPMASCSSGNYELVGELIAYIDAQFLHQDVHVYYLDIWAFPPAVSTIFEECRNNAFASSQPAIVPRGRKRQPRRQAAFAAAGDKSEAFRPIGSIGGYDPSKSGNSWQKIESQFPDNGPFEEWSYLRAQVSDLNVDLSRANRMIKDQQQVIKLLTENLAEWKQKSEAQPPNSRRPFAGFRKNNKK
ncbi:MAG: FkbM family methyltransferase [Proteobacteria bacterium]|nr:FkbM family methyltransferase [Pseudomonadota bacterium]